MARASAKYKCTECIRLGPDRTSTATATADYSQTVCKAVSQQASLRPPIQRNHNEKHLRHTLGGERGGLITCSLQGICTERLSTITHSPRAQAHPSRTKATASRDMYDANAGAAVARAAKYFCKLHSAWSRSRDHRKRIANSCDANKVQLQITTGLRPRSSQRCATDALRMLCMSWQYRFSPLQSYCSDP